MMSQRQDTLSPESWDQLCKPYCQTCIHISLCSTCLSVFQSSSLSISVSLLHSLYLSVYLQIDIHLSVYLTVYLPNCLSVCQSGALCVWLCLSTCLPVWLSVWTPFYLSDCSSIWTPVCLSVHISNILSICLCTCLSLCTAVYHTRVVQRSDGVGVQSVTKHHHSAQVSLKRCGSSPLTVLCPRGNQSQPGQSPPHRRTGRRGVGNLGRGRGGGALTCRANTAWREHLEERQTRTCVMVCFH